MPSQRSIFRWSTWLVLILLFAASIPWYLPVGSVPRIWFGLPHWVMISVTVTLAIAIFTVISMHLHWRETESNPVEGDESS